MRCERPVPAFWQSPEHNGLLDVRGLRQERMGKKIMPEIRLNPITGDWVIIATERARWPNCFASPSPSSTTA